MNITPDQARELLDGATPGPWEAYDPGDGTARLYGADNTRIIEHVTHGDAGSHMSQPNGVLAAAAPDMAQTIAGMRWEYGVEQATGVTQWFRSRPMAEAHAQVHGCFRLVRRLVGPVEVTE
jgi:hypothetical protein